MSREFSVSRATLGQIIRIMREERGLTQEEVWDRTNISTNTLSNLENGVKEPRVSTLDKVAEALGTTSSDLLSRRDQLVEIREAGGDVSDGRVRELARDLLSDSGPGHATRVTKALGQPVEGLFVASRQERRSLEVPDDPSEAEGMISWIADGLLVGYRFDIVAMVGSDGRRYPLPTESAAMANMLERTLVDHFQAAVEGIEGVEVELPRSDRVYPDVAFTGPALKDRVVACDIKVARRSPNNADRTQSRITLYTGNTYFKDPTHNTQNIMRPFNEYALHLDCVALYDFVTEPAPAVRNVELVVVEPWRIGSHVRSSGTRNYIGAITDIPNIRAGLGEFETQDEFYSYWRSYEGWNTSS